MKKLFALLLCCCGVTLAQAPQHPALVKEQPPVVDAAIQLQIRNLQFKQDKILLKMQQLQLEFKDLDFQQKEISATIESLVRDLSRDQKADMKLLVFDLDSLDFVTRKSNR